MTNWQIQIHVVLTKNHASSQCCSQITTVIIHIQEKPNKESVGEKKIFKWHLWYAKYHTQYNFKETELTFEYPSILIYSGLYMHPTMGTCPFHTDVLILIFTKCWKSHIYLLKYTGSVSVDTNFPPEISCFCSIRAASSLYLINCKMKSVQPWLSAVLFTFLFQSWKW